MNQPTGLGESPQTRLADNFDENMARLLIANPETFSERDLDTCTPELTASVLAPLWLSEARTPMAKIAAEFAAAQGCSATTSAYSTPADGTDELSCVQHADCKTGAQVVRCQWNGGHDYPSWGNEDVFWPFLKANPAVSK